jgi:hypothetical protein
MVNEAHQIEEREAEAAEVVTAAWLRYAFGSHSNV